MPIKTRCPDCGHVLSLTNEQLRQVWPAMLCPRCEGRFDPLAGLLDAPPSAEVEAPPQVRFVPADEPSAPAHPASATQNRPPSAPQPDATGLTAVRPRRRTLAWVLACLALCIGLAAQLAWWERASLIRSASARTLLEQACAHLGCRVPLPHLPRELVILDRSLEPCPGPPDVLQLRIELLNQAPTAQAFPVVQLELYDMREQMTAVGRFTPDAYRHEESPQGLESQARGTVALDVIAPADEPSGFRIRLM